MKSSVFSLRSALLLLPLVLLSGCGDGWEVVYSKDIMPYGGQRTAGSAVVYVRKVMSPAKDLNVAPAEAVAPVSDDAAKKFLGAQIK